MECRKEEGQKTFMYGECVAAIVPGPAWTSGLHERLHGLFYLNSQCDVFFGHHALGMC